MQNTQHEKYVPFKDVLIGIPKSDLLGTAMAVIHNTIEREATCYMQQNNEMRVL